MIDEDRDNLFGVFALIGRNPHCGCPLAIDRNGDPEAAREFSERGLLLEYVAEARAVEMWNLASFPCPHFEDTVRDSETRIAQGANTEVPPIDPGEALAVLPSHGSPPLS
jgi:hypothetical protein